MFSQIEELIKSQIGSNPQLASSIPQGQAGEVHQEIAGSLLDGLKSHMSGGGTGDILSMLTGNSQNSGVVSQAVSGGLIDKLTSKFGMSGGVASSLAASVIPGVIQKFFHKASDPNDSSVDPQSVLNHLSDGKTSNINVADALSSFQQGDHSNSGLGSLMNSLGGGSGMLGNVMNMFK